MGIVRGYTYSNAQRGGRSDTEYELVCLGTHAYVDDRGVRCRARKLYKLADVDNGLAYWRDRTNRWRFVPVCTLDNVLD